MQKRASLEAQPRSVVGKRVKHLRRDGILPGNVYGRGLDSQAIQMNRRTFLRTVRDAGVRSMFELTIEGEPDPRLVIIRGLDRETGMGDPIHVDFFQVDLQRRIQASAPVHLVGESRAVKDHGGTLLYGLETIPVRCLPLDLPEEFVVDVSILESFDHSISVGDLDIPEGVEVLVDLATSVATVNPPRLRLEEEEAELEEEEAMAAAAEEAPGEEAPGEEEAPEGESE